jgi:hypothetical protein
MKAGTIFAHSRVPLTTWFQAMWFITQSKGSISTLELSRQLDLKWDSAWLMRQKLGTVMMEDEAARKLDGRKGPNKIPFVIAVATTDEGRPQRLLLEVAEHTGEDIERVARTHLAPSARVVSDGLSCFRAVTSRVPTRADRGFAGT